MNFNEYNLEYKVGDGVYRFKSDDGSSAYGIYLDSFPENIREEVRDDFQAAEIILNSLNGLNVPETSLNIENDEEIFFLEDKGVGKTEDLDSFYESASLHMLTSKTDVKGNIVEGSEGYAPIDYEAFLRSPLTEKASYLKNGLKFKSNTELYKHSLAEIEQEAERHNIDFNPEKLAKTAKKIAQNLKQPIQELKQEGLNNRAENLEKNIDLILEEEIVPFDYLSE